MTRLKVLADVDTGIDDSLALVYLAGLHTAGEIELVGVTCAGGNTTAAWSARNTKYMLNLCGCPEVPVVSGFEGPADRELTTTPETHGPYGLGYNLAPPAVIYEPGRGGAADPLALWRRVIEQARSTGEKVHLLVTGPMTTYVAALKKYPELMRELDGVTIMGGAVDYHGNVTEFAEWNFWVDPTAVTEVFATAAGAPVPTLVPLNVTETITISDTEIESWRDAGMNSELLRVLRRSLKFYFEFHQGVGVGYKAQVHDLFAAMVAVGAVTGEVEKMRLVGVDKRTFAAEPARRGQVVEDSAGAVANVVLAADREVALAEFQRVFPR
ncbi:nucleoside hydrolase [Corynebacterium amycolatum]|uniref:nucleoside hydrolase n=1 Tax=Corynebacterium amycolatum TaxID=43765 RepID=UPI003162FF95